LRAAIKFLNTPSVRIHMVSQMSRHSLALKLETLDDDVKLANYINELLSIDPRRVREVRELIGDTSHSGYRRVHEHLAATLDRLISGLEAGSEELKGSLLSLSKALILVEYQLARKQISDGLASILTGIIRKLMSDISRIMELKEPTRSSEELKKLREKVERARTIIDCLAVLVYRWAR
jgi:hypothetical protein